MKLSLGEKSLVVGLPVLMVALVIHLVAYSLTTGFMAGLLSAVALAIVALLSTMIFAGLTQKREALTAGFVYNLTLLIIAGLVTIWVYPYIASVIPGL
jgi:ABC-type Co2+ transport system permease subunit